jgi:ATP synthase F1 epsilon subunit
VAIPKHLRLEFVTLERAIVHDDVDEVELPGEEGYIGVLPGHAPLLAALKTGEMWYRKGTERKYAFLAAGFVEIVPDRVSVLAEVAERAEDIDLARRGASGQTVVDGNRLRTRPHRAAAGAHPAPGVHAAYPDARLTIHGQPVLLRRL